MKTVITLLVCLMTTVGLAQSTDLEGDVQERDVKINEISVSISVDSAEEVKSTFKIDDIKELIGEVEPNKALNFEIICNTMSASTGSPATLTYRIQGNSDDQNEFLEHVKELRKAAIKYYNNKS